MLLIISRGSFPVEHFLGGFFRKREFFSSLNKQRGFREVLTFFKKKIIYKEKCRSVSKGKTELLLIKFNFKVKVNFETLVLVLYCYYGDNGK